MQYINISGFFVDWVQDIDGNIYWDQFAKSQATTKNGEKYLGKEGYGIDEETGLLVHYKSDGTKNSFIIPEKGTIVAGEKISKGFNWGISLDLNFTFPIGYSIEIGYIQDANQHGSFFYSHGMTAGFEASAGINFIVVPTSNFKLSDFEGQSASLNISTPYLSGSVISDFSRGAEKDYYFNNYGGFKIGGGLGVGASLSHTKTKLLKNK